MNNIAYVWKFVVFIIHNFKNRRTWGLYPIVVADTINCSYVQQVLLW